METEMMKKLLLIGFLPLLLAAGMLKVGDAVTPMVINDQFDKPHGVGNEKIWVVTWDRGTTSLANTFFDEHRKMLADGTAALIVDVSQTPEGIMSLFVLPRMRSYEHIILLSYDAEHNRMLPYRDGAVTVLRLKAGAITAVGYAEDMPQLQQLLLPW
jgi:hypothetical protein